MRLSIVVPAYNEAENIPLILKRFQEEIKDRGIQVIIVDNGSTDNTQDVLDGVLFNYPFVKTVHVPVNKGYGYGILCGLKQADGDYIGWTHADMQTDPKDVAKAYDIIKKRNRNDLFIKGRRQKRPVWDMFFTVGMSVFESVYFGLPLIDINAQPNIFPRVFFEQWQTPPYDFSLDLYALYRAKRMGMKVVRFPVYFRKRQHGTSKWNTGIKSKLKFIKRTIDFSLNLKKREECR